MTKINNYLDKKNSFVLYNDWYEAIEDLTTEEKGLLLDAIFRFHISKEIPPKDSPIKMAFKFLKPMFEANIRSYIAKCEKNRESGLLGGRPPKEPNGFEENQTDKNKPDNDSESVSVSEFESENECESENGEIKKPHPHDFFSLLESELILRETEYSPFAGKVGYQNKVFYFLDKNKEKLESKQDKSDALLHFKSFYENESNRAKGESYKRPLSLEQEKELCLKMVEFFKSAPINEDEAKLKQIVWDERKTLIPFWQKSLPEKIEKHVRDVLKFEQKKAICLKAYEATKDMVNLPETEYKYRLMEFYDKGLKFDGDVEKFKQGLQSLGMRIIMNNN